MLVEPQTDRLDKPTVFRRRVPPAIATDNGLVRPDPLFGHLNLSAVFVGIGLAPIVLRGRKKSEWLKVIKGISPALQTTRSGVNGCPSSKRSQQYHSGYDRNTGEHLPTLRLLFRKNRVRHYCRDWRNYHRTSFSPSCVSLFSMFQFPPALIFWICIGHSFHRLSWIVQLLVSYPNSGHFRNSRVRPQSFCRN